MPILKKILFILTKLVQKLLSRAFNLLFTLSSPIKMWSWLNPDELAGLHQC